MTLRRALPPFAVALAGLLTASLGRAAVAGAHDDTGHIAVASTTPAGANAFTYAVD